jgi:hypothetical protein
MKKTSLKKMSLSRETLRRLEEHKLEHAAGGITAACPTTSDDSTCYFNSCPRTCSYTTC